jgi:hypothetical protein
VLSPISTDSKSTLLRVHASLIFKHYIQDDRIGPRWGLQDPVCDTCQAKTQCISELPQLIPERCAPWCLDLRHDATISKPEKRMFIKPPQITQFQRPCTSLSVRAQRADHDNAQLPSWMNPGTLGIQSPHPQHDILRFVHPYLCHSLAAFSSQIPQPVTLCSRSFLAGAGTLEHSSAQPRCFVAIFVPTYPVWPCHIPVIFLSYSCHIFRIQIRV